MLVIIIKYSDKLRSFWALRDGSLTNGNDFRFGMVHLLTFIFIVFTLT